MLTAAIIAVVIAVAVVAVLVYAATKPDKFGVQRAASIGAPPEKIFPLIDDLHAHTSWSPFEKDPNMKRTHSGAARGKGAVVRVGRQSTGRRRAPCDHRFDAVKVTMALDMLKPFEAHNVVEFTLEPKGGSTNVTWAISGRQPYMAKLMSTFINCDKMVCSQFEEGLVKLKVFAEK